MQKRTDAVRHPSEQRDEGTKAQPHAENQRRHDNKKNNEETVTEIIGKKDQEEAQPHARNDNFRRRQRKV